MICPKCKKNSFKSGMLKSKQLVLDKCSLCKGMWFDKGELTVLLGSQAKQDFSIPKFAAKNPDTLCPRCNVSLYEFCYPGTLTLVDGCRKCKGVWLENREWQSISYARDEKNKISCPKCHTRQAQAESCKKCGIIMAKYQLSETEKKLSSLNPEQKNSANADSISVHNYADDIPGLKGKLLRMIDNAIKKLTSNIGF